MGAFWSALAALPALLSKVLDVISDWQRRRDEAATRVRIEAEVRTDVAQAVETAEIEQAKETHDAMAKAGDGLPDRDAAAQRLRHGQF